MKVLLLAGADVDAMDNSGRSALHVASERGNREIVECLIDYGADPDGPVIPAGMVRVRTPLMSAATRGHVEVVKILVGKGCASLHAQDEAKGSTALHLACAGGHLEVVEILCNAGANSCQVDTEGKDPIQIAIETSNDYERLTMEGIWNPKRHYEFPQSFRQATRTFLLVLHKIEGANTVGSPLPKGALLNILRMAAWPISIWASMLENLENFHGRGSPFDILLESMAEQGHH